ncbi:aminoacyl-tRNA hydrolase [Microbulbifer thermotolerans]|uniref:Peptidyl-tRNA hydrolase n=1 Tax=Microbulbifer thermotolerans TaxID=252514 RepID=A0A143HJW7_MICTH|nr:aminoacyl-tRNA hydrolase [Microbulbifer thermotolerans]AMX01998.1 aminoacyl-tRNA hydrolase [Microbulbifer thermotolerans]
MAKAPETPIQLIVGLGNPGPEYDRTRHNAGADFVAELARHCGGQLSPDSKYHGLTSRVRIGGEDVRLLIPTTYMNRSGQSVGPLANFFKIPAQAILVAHDELDLPPGTARLKAGGGHGGHNGLRDIIAALGNNRDFKRLRLGIGHPGSAREVVNYVLARAPRVEQEQLATAIERAMEIIPAAVAGDWEAAMKTLHTQKPGPGKRP